MEGNRAWGLSLIAATLVIHRVGITALAFVLRWIRSHLEASDRLKSHHLFAILIGLIGAVGLLLGVLHGAEAALWAAAYLWVGALAAPSDALLYSLDSVSTRRRIGADPGT
jgi:hypothetical protein